MIRCHETMAEPGENDQLTENYTLDCKLEAKRVIVTKVYTRRWFILALYVAYMACNSMQWLQYATVSKTVSLYFGVTEWSVNLTSLVMMVCYLPLALPAAYLMDVISLKWTAVLGASLTALGSWVKVLGARPGGFPLSLGGQALVASAQVLMLSVPQKLSSVWFGEREVSTACSIGVFGFQLGIVVGFFAPPVLVKSHEDQQLVGRDLKTMMYLTAGIATFLALMVILLFQSQPPHPPTASQARAPARPAYLPTLRRLFSSRSLIAYFLTTGLNNGCFNGFSTLLSQIFVSYFPGMEEDGGRVGTTMVVFGMLGSVSFGILLDKTKKFKLVLNAVYYMAGVATMVFAFVLGTRCLWMVYLAAAFVGTFLCGFTAVSMDVATELTYPESEIIVGTIMNMMSLLFTFLTTLLFGAINDYVSFFWGTAGFAIALLFGAACMQPIPFVYKRTVAMARSNSGREEKCFV